MLQGEHSAILLTFIKLSFIIEIFVLSILSGRFAQVLLYNEINSNFRILTTDGQIFLKIMFYAFKCALNIENISAILTLNAQNCNKSHLLFSSTEMFKKPLWQTGWTQI